MESTNTNIDVLIDRDTFAKKFCHFQDNYHGGYWRDAVRYGSYLANYIFTKNPTDEEIKTILNGLQSNECLGIYTYFNNKLTDNQLWNRILKLNPFGEDLIFNSYVIWFDRKDDLLSEDIKQFPEQLNKFIGYLKSLDPDTLYEHISRIKALRCLLNNNDYDSEHSEFGNYSDFSS